MTKKHFIKLADALRTQKPADHWDPNKMVQWKLDVEAIADVCLDVNPLFNYVLWKDYLNGRCGPNGGEIKQPKTTSERH